MIDRKKPLKTKGFRTIFTKPHFFVAIAKRFAIVRSSPVTNQLPNMKTQYTATMTVEITRSGFELRNNLGEVAETAEQANKGKLHRILSNQGYKPSAKIADQWEK